MRRNSTTKSTDPGPISLPRPVPGLVIHYAYLWHEERRGGREEAGKDRPCVVVLAVSDDEDGTIVVVAPVTHRRPDPPQAALEIPLATKQRLGLDAEPSWVVLTEVNRFGWPGPDLRPIPGSEPPRYEYGLLPAKLIYMLRERLLALAAERGAVLMRRSE